MKARKTLSANLENKRFIFFEIGFIIALSAVLVAFEWSGREKVDKSISIWSSKPPIEVLTPITDQREEKLVPPPPPVIMLTISKDPDELIDQPVLPGLEAKLYEEIGHVQYKDEKPVIDSNEIFRKAEEMPKYHGKPAGEFGRFIGQHLKYPEIAAQNGVQGTVKVKFIIDQQGKLVDATIYRSVDPALDQEALRVVNLSDRWTPGKQRSIPVKVAFVFPIEFSLENR